MSYSEVLTLLTINTCITEPYEALFANALIRVTHKGHFVST